MPVESEVDKGTIPCEPPKQFLDDVSVLAKSRTAVIVVDDDGSGPIVAVRILPDVHQSLEDARANIEACIHAAGSRRCRLLVDLRRAQPLPAEVRHYYSGEKLTQWFSAMAFLVEASPMGQVMGNLYLRITRPGIPTRLFNEKDAAMNWLRKDVV